jgi:MOSC domain-containing protein YiiM
MIGSYAGSMPSLLAVCVVHQLRPDAGTVGITAIDKRAVSGEVKVGRFGVYADVQADRKDHGGLDQAVYAYAQGDADWWSAELGRDLHPGWFGENLRVSGLDLRDARVGDRWRLGRGVELEVTKARTPCMTFARWAGEERNGWVRRFSDARRLGTYLRVVSTGRVQAGDDIELVPAPAGAPAILDLYAGV